MIYAIPVSNEIVDIKEVAPFINVFEIWHYKGYIWGGWWRKDFALSPQLLNSARAELLLLLEEGGEILWDDHKGTNNAIKAGPSGVLPQHGIDKTIKIQVDTDSNKFDLYQRHWASALFGRATWSNSPTVNDITLPAKFMLKFAVDEWESYASWRTSPYKWLLVRSVDRHVHSLIPCFHIVYTVTSHEFGNRVCLMCDCN